MKKTFLYIKLHQTKCLYFPILFPSSVSRSLRHPSLGFRNNTFTLRERAQPLPLRKRPVFQGVSPWHTIFISPWVIPLWDSATAHLPSAQELNSYSQGDARFSGFAPWHSISLHPSSSLFETQQELTHTLVKGSSLPL